MQIRPIGEWATLGHSSSTALNNMRCRQNVAMYGLLIALDKPGSFSRPMGDCSRLAIHTPPTVRAPSVHSVSPLFIVSVSLPKRVKQTHHFQNDFSQMCMCLKINPNSVNLRHLPRRETMCSLWETPLCCSGTRRRFSAPGKSGRRKRWLEDSFSSDAVRLFCLSECGYLLLI